MPIATQWDDGQHKGAAPGRVPTSSASTPSAVAAMLRDLDVHDTVKVLEIGTGTGWNAAPLASRLGNRQVTSVDVDPAVAAAAVHAAGLHPTLVVADGLLGYPRAAPYDRVIATMAVRSIPWAWVQQTTPAGVIVAPWCTHYSHADVVALLVVADGHGCAEGRFTRPVEFMTARAHRLAKAPHAAYIPGGDVASVYVSCRVCFTPSATGGGVHPECHYSFSCWRQDAAALAIPIRSYSAAASSKRWRARAVAEH